MSAAVDQLLGFFLGEFVFVLAGVPDDGADCCANSCRMTISVPVLPIALRRRLAAALCESARITTKRSPMAAMTACAVSHAVVTAPTMTMRPIQVSVRPPSVPTLRSHLPS